MFILFANEVFMTSIQTEKVPWVFLEVHNVMFLLAGNRVLTNLEYLNFGVNHNGQTLLLVVPSDSGGACAAILIPYPHHIIEACDHLITYCSSHTTRHQREYHKGAF